MKKAMDVKNVLSSFKTEYLVIYVDNTLYYKKQDISEEIGGKEVKTIDYEAAGILSLTTA